MNRRRGFSLIEVLTAITVGSVMIGVAVGMLYTLWRAQGVAREHLHHRTVLSRLDEQFRRDVHAAVTLGQDDATAAWTFVRAPGHTVTYRAESGGLVRVETAGEEPPRQERFALPPGMIASIEVDSETSPAIVSLLVAPAAESNVEPGRRMARFEAALAADHRFVEPAGPPEDDTASVPEVPDA